MIIYDCEIYRGILKRGEQPEPGIEYCDGWEDYANMGVTVIGCYDCRHDQYRVFLADNFGEFQRLVDEVGEVAGFNNQKFDDQLMRQNDLRLPAEKSYDLLAEVWAAAGLSRTFNFKTHMGYGLDALSNVNINAGKSGAGALAPVLWQRHQYGEVIDYCLQDVWLTKRLLFLAAARGYLISPKDDSRLHITLPDWFINETEVLTR